MRGDDPCGIAGTTYMAGDAHRKFLFQPNPAVWDRDFAAMKASGVNMVRTGIWTGWQRAMLNPGAVDAAVLRAFEAFVLTAQKHDIPLIFTLFAFTPEVWEGANPYLDPRAIAAQKEFAAAFVACARGCDNLVWDLINRASFSSPAALWRTRPNYDRFERAAWAAWLQERAGQLGTETPGEDPDDVWRVRWGLDPGAPLDLPAPADFADQDIFQDAYPMRARDYRLFAQDMFAGWVAAMREAICAAGGASQLVTVGQDEGGCADRPNTHFMAKSIDFTTDHSWWQNGDLLWDSVLGKTPGRPCLIQETGVMFLENPDGRFRRTWDATAALLAQKLALSLAAGCAGAIQWLWNTNTLMESDNEVAIGLHAADGVAKPEMTVFAGFAAFVQSCSPYLRGRKEEPAVLLLPHSAMFHPRDTAAQATRMAVRVMAGEMGVPLRAVGEYQAELLGAPVLFCFPPPTCSPTRAGHAFSRAWSRVPRCWQPGRLTAMRMAGRRAAYVHSALNPFALP